MSRSFILHYVPYAGLAIVSEVVGLSSHQFFGLIAWTMFVDAWSGCQEIYLAHREKHA